MKKLLISLCILLITACSVSYDSFYKLTDDYLEQRLLSTRYFETNKHEDIIIASVQLLQDLGYTIKESNLKLGLITATKNREILNDGKVAGMTALAVFVALLGGSMNTNFPKVRELQATLIVTESNTNKGYNVRVEFSSATYYTQGNIVLKRDTDEKIYQDFFEKLGQSIFITPHNI